MCRPAAIGVRCALLVAVGLPAAGCSRTTEAPSTIRYPLYNDPETLDPARATDENSLIVIRQMFEGLVFFDKDNSLVPHVATSWDISPDRKTYTFHLRTDAKFHNGRAVTADDFVYSINRALADSKSTVASLYLNDIVGAGEVLDRKTTAARGLRAINPATLEITIDAPKAYFLAKLTYPTAFVVAREETEAGGERWTEPRIVDGKPVNHCIGTGPFRITEWQRNVQVRLVPFNEYWGVRAKVQSVEFPVVRDQQSRLSRFDAGELEGTDITAPQYAEFSREPARAPELHNWTRLGVVYLALNSDQYPPFKDPRVRRAFAYAIDQQRMSHVVLNDVFLPAEGILPPGMPGYEKDFAGIPFDPKDAQRLLREAGFDAKTHPLPHLVLQYSNVTPDWTRVAPVVRDMLSTALGIEVELQLTEWNTLLADTREGRPQFYLIGWGADYIDPQNFLSIMLYSTSRNNRTGYNSPEFDRLCDAGDIEPDPAKRSALYAQANRLCIEDAAWVPLYFGSAPRLFKSYVQGLESNLLNVLPFNTVTLDPK